MDDADRQRTIAQLYEAVRARPATEQSAMLDAACPDPVLRLEVERLLATESDAPTALTPPASSDQIDPTAATRITGASSATLGPYRIERLLGQGGVGAVYLAYDPTLHRQVALKVMAESDAQSARHHLLREARAAAGLSHPNICAIHEVGEADGSTFIAMEHVEGRTLRGRIDNGPLPLDEAVRYGVQVADALAFAHDRGVVHRDMKAANVIVTSAGRLKIVDFGLARRGLAGSAAASTADSLVPAGAVAGTPYAMAPEQVRGEETDARTDIWALGVMLYEMLTGQRPFAGETTTELFASILRDQPAPALQSGPRALRDVIERCLARAPAERYQRASDVRAALEAMQVGASGPVRKRRPRSHTRMLLTAVTAAAVLLVASLVVGLSPLGRWLEGPLPTDVIAFEARDWLVIANVDNRPGDSLFDQTLDTALEVGLGQSPYVNVMSASQVAGALQRMQQPPDRLDAALAREVAQREGARLVLAPAITEVGGVYQLTGRLEDPATGATVGSAVVRAGGKDEVLPGVDELITQVRNTLGEARSSIAELGQPLAQVTTGSLEALKVYTAAAAANMAARMDETMALLEEALRLDPSFTAARALLGQHHYDVGDRAKGLALLAQAIDEIGGLTERERIGVRAWHAASVENDPEQAIDLYRSLLALYPDHASAHHNTGRAYVQMGLWDAAVAAFGRALEINPYSGLAYNNLNTIYLHQLGD